jgi:hypothetical protein
MGELVVARAMKSQNPEFWQKVPFYSIREMLKGIIMWSKMGGDHNPSLLTPDNLSSKIQFYFAQTASLDDILEWALANIYSEEERKVATARRTVISF